MSHPNLAAQDQLDTLDLRAYLRPVWRWKWIVLAITLLAGAGTYVITSREHKTYVASTEVYVQNADPVTSVNITNPQAPGPPSAQALQDIATLFTGQSITATVYRRLHLTYGSAGTVAVSPSTSSSFVDVSASSPTPTLAATLANTYARVFIASQASSVAAVAQGDAKAARATLKIVEQAGGPTVQAQRASLLAQIDQYETIARSPSPGARQVDTALPPTSPSSPKPTRDAIFAAVIGLLLGIAVVFMIDRFDRRLIRVSAVRSLYHRPVIAVLPRLSRTAQRNGGSNGAPHELMEAMLSLRVNVRMSGEAGRVPKSVLVTSAVPSEGKSTVARNLAFACADAGDRVLLVDCDLRRPSVAEWFGIEPAAGLAQILRREASPAVAAVTVFEVASAHRNGSNGFAAQASGDPRANGSINVITAGESVESPVALLSSPAMTNLLAGATTLYDIVILDTSPVLTVSDAVPLLDQVGAVLFVARLGMTTRDAAGRLTELGERVPGMNLAGVIVNDVRDRFLDEGYGYTGAYGYDYTKAKV
jgi:Mrp family chromosome partitioning ATPase/capsular polysaccharide biosynthesis protein